MPPSPAPLCTRTLLSATIGAVRNRSRRPNSLTLASSTSDMVSPFSRSMEMTRPSGRFASTRSSERARPPVREVLGGAYSEPTRPMARGADGLDGEEGVGGQPGADGQAERDGQMLWRPVPRAGPRSCRFGRRGWAVLDGPCPSRGRAQSSAAVRANVRYNPTTGGVPP